ncbi:hypothetical protein A3734_16755 [Sulfitobacter sp. HI0054]|uniref:HIRAN domain-containing protein n=1 Tax=Sulfitobacter sp. HI0054 TaxID=1822238 RepID=UPI0007C3BA99|nr:HIRAN domain-containing protein [Sulfitobacter sp. HI0054]KZY53126.1 hypothetical protein A3734_16755 [Sulfitobacter sp. HI0054]
MFKKLFGFGGNGPAGASSATHKGTEAVSPEDQVLRSIVRDFELAPSGDEQRSIVGESFYQENLEGIAGGKNEQSAEIIVRVELRRTPNNPYDSNAVGVFVEDLQVGNLSREDAKVMGSFLLSEGVASAQCLGTIIGGWKRKDSEGHFGLELDIAWPPAEDDE